MGEVGRVIERFALRAHPEGGWYRRTWTAPLSGGDAEGPDRRAPGSAILYLLADDADSRWHRIDASELWHHVAGSPVRVSQFAPGDPASRHETLGPALFDGETPQVVVAPGAWQSAATMGAWSLVACVVVPEFRFEHFELAPDGWQPPH